MFAEEEWMLPAPSGPIYPFNQINISGGGSDKLIHTRIQMINLVESVDLSRAPCFLIVNNLFWLLNAEEGWGRKIQGELGKTSWQIILYARTSTPCLRSAKQVFLNQDRAQHLPFYFLRGGKHLQVNEEHYIFLLFYSKKLHHHPPHFKILHLDKFLFLFDFCFSLRNATSPRRTFSLIFLNSSSLMSKLEWGQGLIFQ